MCCSSSSSFYICLVSYLHFSDTLFRLPTQKMLLSVDIFFNFASTQVRRVLHDWCIQIITKNITALSVTYIDDFRQQRPPTVGNIQISTTSKVCVDEVRSGTRIARALMDSGFVVIRDGLLRKMPRSTVTTRLRLQLFRLTHSPEES